MKNPKRTLSKPDHDRWLVNILMLAHAIDHIGDQCETLQLDQEDIDILNAVGNILSKLKNGPAPRRRQMK